MTREMTQVLRLQWLASRWLLLPVVLLCVGLPQAVVRMSVLQATGVDRVLESTRLLESLDGLSVVFPYLAAITGALIALAAWNWDHRTGHVYSLSLPVSRARYALLKVWAGAVILLVPTIAIWIGAWIATTTVTIPDGLRVYPFAFGARFLLSAVLMYAVMFALASGTIRTTVTVMVTGMLVIVVGSIVIPQLEMHYLRDLRTPMELIGYALTEWGGPFRVFSGGWLLIDV